MMQSDESVVGKIAWARLERCPWASRYCETPRHAEQLLPAAFVVGFHEGEDAITYSACNECVGVIAADLGVPVEEGIL